ncbi:U-box domain-containing protein 5-like isoform X2 [Salvia hispanica]|uniref:U-box domain-containing protein 5-like isoform X2 n=1 Tax=Salvia hispanica TaxID=49212 RepID=UPI002009072A|nr:U-box domain-containing protein 5-like isoform X2 [Salvia hispanica]
MSRVYDLWEKLVGAVLDREERRRLALRSSSNSSCSSFSDCSSRFSFVRSHAEIVQELLPTQTFKVHAQIYSELFKVVVRVSKNLPEIEAARPRCSTGIETICLLNAGIDKAKSLLQQCSESSVLYLALTGDAILFRCKGAKNLLVQNLCQIQYMVPVLLAAKISRMIADLRSAAFFLDPSDEEAGRILRELIHSSAVDYTEEAALAAIHTVSSRLHISSQKALLTEKRSLQKLLDKFGEKDSSMRKILIFFLNLLKKYGKVIAETENDNAASERGNHFPYPNPYHLTEDVELRTDYRSNESHINTLSRPVPPEEFICPLSSRLMYDPVVIESGQTYERMWIQKWFVEGHCTCPKTHVDLSNLSFTSNATMKDLIIKWSAMHSVSVPDPKKMHEGLLMVGLNLPLDYSNLSMGSSLGSDYSNTMISNEVRSIHEIDWEFLSKFTTLPWDSQCNAVDDTLKKLIHNEQYLVGIPLRKFVQLIHGFLKDAYDRHDMEAQMTGCQLLYEVVQKHSASYLKEVEYGQLALLLDTEVSKQALFILEELSNHQQCGQKIAASGALVGVFNILDSQIQELLEPALKILRNLSSNGDVGSFITPSELMPKLVPLFEDDSLASHCIVILRNMCDGYTDGCIAAMAKVLESNNREDQEYAVSVLLKLCSQRVEFCQLAMEEGVIPGFVSISVKGNRRAAAMASEMRRILKEYTTGENSGADAASAKLYPQRNDTKHQDFW